MTGKQFIQFILRSFVLGLIVAALILLLVPDLRRGSGLQLDWFKENTGPVDRESYFDALSRSAPAVVNIYSIAIENNARFYRNQAFERTSLGSGVIMTDNGYVLTCYHVIGGADAVVVRLQDGRTIEDVQIVGYDRHTDLAVLKINAADLHVMPQLEDPKVRVGDVVMAIGNPYDLGQTITKGIVSRAGYNGLANYVDYIQTDAVLNQGNSGGALVDSNGHLVGITNSNFQVKDSRQRVVNASGINFAVPYLLAKRVMDDIINNGRVIRGHLGFNASEVSNLPGLMVTRVDPQGPAGLAGLQAGDIILAIDGVQVESGAQTLDRITETKPGTTLKLDISRQEQLISMEATVAELPDPQ